MSPRRPSSPHKTPPQWVEWSLLAAICLLAVWLRIGTPTGLAVEHFDEGVYASNLWFDAQQGYAYPMRHLYAPPVVPFVAEWSLILTGLAPAAPIWAGVMAGLALVPSLWWIGRSWFGSLAGLTSAALVAASDLHVLFSRTILTEPWMLLGLVWAVFFLERAARTRRMSDIAIGGLLTGVTWWTKYNGWLPLAIAGAGTVVHHVVHWRSADDWRREVTRSLTAWAGATLVAVLVWSPVPFALRDHGGYSAVAANHRRYVVGLSGWWESAQHQLANLYSLEAGATRLLGPAGVALVLLVTVVVAIRLKRSSPSSSNEADRKASQEAFQPRADELAAPASRMATLGAIVAPWLGTLSSATVSLLAVFFVVTAIVALLARRHERAPSVTSDAVSDSKFDNQGLAFVASWFVGLLVATPCYHPYARLTLPGVVAVWLGGGWAISHWHNVASRFAIQRRVTAADSRENERKDVAKYLLTGSLLFAVLAAIVLVLGPKTLASGWSQRGFLLGRQSRGELARAARELTDAAVRDATGATSRDSSAPIIFYVYGEPAVFFQLRASGQTNVAPVADPSIVGPPADHPDVPTYLITGPHAADESTWETKRDRQLAAGRWSLIARTEFQPSDVLRLDHEDPRSTNEPRRYELFLYRVR